MLIPIGLDSTRLSRWPAASLAIAVACTLAWALTSFSGADGEALAARQEAVRYLVQHPWLAPPAQLLERLGVEEDDREAPPPPPGLSAPELQRQQQELEGLVEAFAAAQDATPLFRFSLVPARGPFQLGWLTHLFLHAGFLHLAGNLFLFLLVVGPFLEDAWGVGVFTAFYLVGGVVAALAQVPTMPPGIPLLGASGAISACMGAFCLRFAHRRVRMFYWFWLVVRGQFFVPAWLYALLAFAGDLLGLWASGRGGGVAYGAHVGGFVFGLAVAGAVKAWRLEERFAPEGAVRWRGGMALDRAAEALADGDLAGARHQLQDSVRRRPGDVEAALELARLEARGFDRRAVTEALEPVLERRAQAGDAEGLRALLREFGDQLRPDALRPATAYRVAELAGDADGALALALYEAAGAAGGGVGVKAYLKAARRLAAADPERARELAARAEHLATDAALAAQARGVLDALPQPRPPEAPADLLPEEAPFAAGPLKLLWCRLAALQGAALDLTTPEGRTARLAPARVEAVAAAQLERLVKDGVERRNGVVLDLVLRVRPGEPRVVLRLAGHELNLAAHRPGMAPAQAFAELVGAILAEGGGQALPDTARAQGRPFARLPDLAAFERACYGRELAAPQ